MTWLNRFWKRMLFARLKKLKRHGWLTSYGIDRTTMTVATHEQDFVLWDDVERIFGRSK